MSEINIRRILVVDDEPSIVNAVQRELNTPPFDFYDYTVEGFTDPAQALRRAQEIDFDAVISDYHMPGMNGIEFLRELAALRPDCVRLVLSGQADMEALTRLVNESRIYRFIPKPWSATGLKAALAQALDYSAVLLENRRLAALAAERGIVPPPDAEDAVDQILIVDDDMGVLNSLSRSLRRHTEVDDLVTAIRSETAHGAARLGAPHPISIQATASPAHALRLAEIMTFSCVVCDYRMPEMDGGELLNRIAFKQPDCSRILVSGAIEMQELARVLNRAHIFAFLEKPWSDYDLKTNVLLGITRHRMLLENRKLAELVG